MNYQEYIQSELLILVPVLYCIGIGLKKSRIQNKRIPILLGGIAVMLSAVWVLATCDIATYKELAAAVFMAVTQGILAAGASVYANQLYQQANKGKGEKEYHEK